MRINVFSNRSVDSLDLLELMYLVVQLFTIVAHGFMGEHCLVERTPWINKVVFAVVGFVVS